MKRIFLLACLCVIGSTLSAQSAPPLAPTPPMGWNSWDAYGFGIDEAQFKDSANWLHQHLQQYGWQYVVIDEGWFLQQPYGAVGQQGFTMSANGLYLPAVNRFPSAAGGQGFKPLADSLHAMGLKFGIHIVRGISREAVKNNLPIAGSSFHAADAADQTDLCRWNTDNYGVKDNAAGQAYYDSVMKLYASWDLDFLKIDCISSPYHAAEIRMVSTAIKRSGRPIVLSLSPGPTPLSAADDVIQRAQQWRISDDFWDLWSSSSQDKNGFPATIKTQFGFFAKWEPYAGPGHWPDGDMLPIGYLGPHPGWGEPRQSRLTHEEERTLITLWSIARSPLILGANLTRMDADTESLLNNPEVIAVDQKTTGNHPIETASDSAIVLWTAQEGPDFILAVFNRSDEPARIASRPWKDLGDQFGLHQSSYRVRDLWQRKNLGRQNALSVTLPPHGAALLRLAR